MNDWRDTITRCGHPSSVRIPWLCPNRIQIGSCPDPECQGAQEKSLLEALAALEHEQWSCWAKERDPGHPLIYVPYEVLTEKEKEKDRVWARKVIDLLY